MQRHLANWRWDPITATFQLIGQPGIQLTILSTEHGVTFNHCGPVPIPSSDHPTDVSYLLRQDWPEVYRVILTRTDATVASANITTQQARNAGFDAKTSTRETLGPAHELHKKAYFDEVLRVIQRYEPDTTELDVLTAGNVGVYEPLPFFGRYRHVRLGRHFVTEVTISTEIWPRVTTLLNLWQAAVGAAACPVAI